MIFFLHFRITILEFHGGKEFRPMEVYIVAKDSIVDIWAKNMLTLAISRQIRLKIDSKVVMRIRECHQSVHEIPVS